MIKKPFKSKYDGKALTFENEVANWVYLAEEDNIEIDGVKNVQHQIDACLEETLVYNIINNYIEGNEEAFNHRQDGVYENVVSFPTNIHEGKKAKDNLAKIEKFLKEQKEKYDSTIRASGPNIDKFSEEDTKEIKTKKGEINE